MPFLLAILTAALLAAQPAQSPVPPKPLDYVCPMDPDVRAAVPGKCPRCGMNLKLGVPDPIEVPLDLRLQPKVPRAGTPVHLTFRIYDPKTGKPAQKFQIVHERLFHMFLVSEDLSFFLHDHPVLSADHTFRLNATFPKPGMYRVLSDFYPAGATPQLITRTVLVSAPGEPVPLTAARLNPDLAKKQATNLDVELVTEPARPLAGMKTLMFFRLKPADGLELYLGAWGHMLAASDDLVDLMHEHPFLADGGPQIQFNMIFPRARTYRVWVQFQRQGVINTVAFNVPVSALQ